MKLSKKGLEMSKTFQKIKTIIIPILILGLFLITACEQEKIAPAKGAFLGGTQGLTVEFEPFGVEEEGIYTIFDEETFPLEVTIHNKGEYELKSGEVNIKLLGPSPEEFSGISSWELSNSGIVDAISELVPSGGEETFSFATDAQYTSEVTGLIDRHWFANVEYDYNTFLIIPEICLREDLTDQSLDKICKVNEAKTFFVSGAPITVKSVQEDTAGKGIMALKIKVSNAGNGKVTKVGESFGVRSTLSFTIDDAAWECKSGGKINEARLIDGEAEIICKLKTALAEDHISTKQVKLTLEYKYRDLIQEKLRIKQSG